MNIKQSVYEGLTNTQRITAALEAIKRQDQGEAIRLLESILFDEEGKNVNGSQKIEVVFVRGTADTGPFIL